MPLYLANPSLTTDPLDGSNTISCPVSGPGVGWIHLGPPGTNQGKALIYSPNTINTAGFDEIGTIADESVNNPTRNRIGNALGISLTSNRLNLLIAEILMDKGDIATRWGGIRGFQNRLLSRYEIWLGALGLVWSEPTPPLPSTQSFTETWPNDGDVTAVAHDQTWFLINGDPTISAGMVQRDATAFPEARCESTLDTSSQSHQADFTLDNDATGNYQVRVLVRHADASNAYRLTFSRNNSVFLRETSKRVAGANTVFASDTTDPGASGTMKLIVDGSTITGQLGGSTILGPTTDASPQLTGNLKGGFNVFAPASGGNARLDNHTIADVATLVRAHHFMLIGVGA